VRLAWVIVLVGCGRLGFETSRDGALGDDDGGPGSDALTDGPMNTDAMDTIVTFGENPGTTFNGVTRDTYISMNQAASNFGGADNIRIERDNGERGLLEFTITQVPTTATVLSARIRFFLEVGTPGATISFHRVNENWDEGTVDGTTGTANYMFRSGVIPWSLTGAYPPSIDAAVLGTFPGTTTGAMVDVDLPASLVQTWVSDPGENDGLLFESNNDNTVRLVSSEGPSGMRPVLTVTYE
jgi:hypothetical protein